MPGRSFVTPAPRALPALAAHRRASATRENRDAVLAASRFGLTKAKSDLLAADDGVIGRVQVIGAGAVEVNPTLDDVAGR